MKIHQLRYVREVVRQDLNVTKAAEALYTAQPGISKQIRLLEEELRVQIFVRKGKRVVAITKPGQVVVEQIERILLEMQKLKQLAQGQVDGERGELTIATTHTQARYTLPHTVRYFRKRYPGVKLSIHQGNPQQVCLAVQRGEADFAIATEGVRQFPDLLAFPCHPWNRSVIAPIGHPILQVDPVTLAELARWPIVTYDTMFSGRAQMDASFAAHKLHPDVVLTAADSDVIKTYVLLGLGIGIIATMAFDASRDSGLGSIEVHALFPDATTHIGIRRGGYLPAYAYDFITHFAPVLTRERIEGKASEGA